MKTWNFISILIGSFALILTACQPFYLTSPQPYDSKNIYEFPKEYRGLMINKDSSSYSFDQMDTIIIGKNYFIIKDYKQTNAIAKKEIDSSKTYLIKNNKIYIKSNYEEIPLSEGYPYKLINDTIYFNARDITKVMLSHDTFLRKVANYYILNTSNNSTWWFLYLIKKKADNKLEVYILDEKDLDNISNYELIYSTKEGIFLDARWNKKELLNIIQNGGFSLLILELDLKDKRPLPTKK